MTADDRRAREDLAEHFAEYAAATESSSPLYGRLLAGCAGDEAILELAAAARPGQPAALLLLAAVHYLLLAALERGRTLARFYPSVGGDSARPDDPFPAFRAFCLERREDLRALIETRRVQTNEVGRSACLLPAFGLVARLLPGRPLALVEVGASAGMNLLWDRYVYDYGDGELRGDPGSPVRLACALRGPGRPPLARRLPTFVSRVGVDLHPVDVRDADAARWLRALVWPEHHERAATLQRAIELARHDPPRLLTGDALDLLPGVLETIPSDAIACVVHTHAVYQFAPADRARLRAILAAHPAGREVVEIGMEPVEGGHSRLDLIAFRNGASTARYLADCDYHGAWIAWRDVANQ